MSTYKCSNCVNYPKCEYYHNRRKSSKICNEFILNISINKDELREMFRTPEKFVNDYDNFCQRAGLPPMTEREKNELIKLIYADQEAKHENLHS